MEGAAGAPKSAARPGIEDLADRLRRAKLPIGASEELDAVRLVLRLGQTRRSSERADDLKRALRPVFCKRVEDRATFDATFDDWFKTLEEGKAPPGPPQPRQRSKSWRPWFVISMLAAAAALSLVWRSTDVPVVVTDKTAPPVVASAATVPDDTPVIPAEPTPHETYVPAQRENRELDPRWVFLGLCIALIPLLLVQLPAAVLARGRSRSGRTVHLDARRVEAEALKLVPPLHTEAAARLSRHLRGRAFDPRRLSRRPGLDVRRTIEATLMRLGVPTLRYRHAHLRPSYLMLIDGDIEKDPRARLFYEWAKRLMHEGWDVEIRAFRAPAAQKPDDAPRTYRIENSGWSEARFVEVPMDHLEDPPVGQRLLVLSDSAALVDNQNHLRPWFRRAHFKRWRERVIFTPTQMRFWGPREIAVEESEGSADPGFLVLPLDEPALEAWSLLLTTGRLANFTLSEPERYPPLLAEHENEVVGEQPFAVLEPLVAELKRYLGDTGFRWLAALAVPPLWRWDLTLLIGRALVDAQSSGTVGPRNSLQERGRQALLVSLNYRRLTQLPWLRAGLLSDGTETKPQMPHWLRLRLLHELPAGAAAQVREAVTNALSWATPATGNTGLSLELEEPPGADSAGRKTSARDAEESDALYLGYMSGLTPEQLVLRAPAAWSPWLKALRLPVRGRGFRGASRRLSNALGALWARFAFRDGIAASALRPASGLLASGALLLWGLLVSSVASTPPEMLPFGLGERLFVSNTYGAGLANIRIIAIQFAGPNGERIYTMDEDGIGRVLDASNGRELSRWRGPQYVVRQAMFSRDAKRVMTRSSEVVDVWDATTGARRLSIARDSGPAVSAAALSASGTRLAVASITLGTWDVDSGARVDLGAFFPPVFWLDFDPLAERLAVSTSDRVSLMDLGLGAEVWRFPVTFSEDPAKLRRFTAFSSDGSHVFVAFDAGLGTVGIDGRVVRAERGVDPTNEVSVAAGIPRAAALARGSVEVVETTGAVPKVLSRLEAAKGSACVEMSPDGSRVATCADDGVHIFDAVSGAEVAKLAANSPGQVRFSANGTHVAVSRTADPTLRLWSRKEQGSTDAATLAPVPKDLALEWLLGVGGAFFKKPWIGLLGLGAFVLATQVWERLRLRFALARRPLG